MTNNKVLEFVIIRMGKHIEDNGWMDASMEKVIKILLIIMIYRKSDN